MQPMQIESITIRNYRLFRAAAFVELPRICLIVGANGSGKSTLFDVFSFLKDALNHNVGAAVARRGGFRELASRGQPGPIGIEIKFRESGGRLATYELEVAEDGGRPVVHRELLKFRRGQYGRPWHFVDFSRGRGTAITNEAAYGQEGVEAARAD
jgi:predicted ATPase